MQHLIYTVTHSVVPTNFSLLAIKLYSSVVATLVYNDTKYSVPFMTLQPSSTVYCYGGLMKIGKTCWKRSSGGGSMRGATLLIWFGRTLVLL